MQFLVISLALLRASKNGVGFGDFDKVLRRIGVLAVVIWMIRLGEEVVLPFYIGRSSILRYLECLVMIAGPGIIVLDVRGVVEVEGRGGATSKPSDRKSVV